MHDIRSEVVEYQADGRTMKGYVAWDAGNEGPRPGILVVHEWWGHNDYVERRARELAELGYVGFALDLYGDGHQAGTPDEAGRCAGEIGGDLGLMTRRFQAALDALKARPEVDAERVAAIGYCFGGTVALGMARQGLPLDGVVAFHAGLSGVPPVGDRPIQARLRLFTGEEDPMAPPADVDAFIDEMVSAGVKIEVTRYPGVQHAFTNPVATERGKEYGLPLAYDANADEDSWKQMAAFFQELWPE